jgi:transcriptional antiterminator RfaH
MKQWYVIRAKPKKEAMAASLLERQGIEVFVPTIKVRKAASREQTTEPLFPGYFFSRLDPHDSELTAAKYTFNVLYILGYGDEPWPIPDTLVATIQQRLGGRSRRSSPDSFRTGEPVLITHGPFKGIEAVFDGYLTGSGRVRVLIRTLQSAFRAEIHVDQLGNVRQAAKEAVA